MSILNLMTAYGDSYYYTDEWRQLIDDHLPLLKVSPNTVVHEITAQAAHQYEGNFSGYLIAARVPDHLHYIAFRLNGFKSDSDLTEDVRKILLPYAPDIEKLMIQFRTTYQ